MKQKKIFVPTTNAESWKHLLADPDLQWKDGYSAKMAADSWENASGIPIEIQLALSKDYQLNQSELLLAIPEFKVPLPGGSRPSQNDLLVVISNSKGLSVITVESKAKEDFDKTITEWSKNSSAGKEERLKFILKKINFPNVEYGHLRYQLFHRMASAIIMAEKFHAKNAVMIIQSFIKSDIENHYNDFEQFINTYGKECQKGTPIKITNSDNINIYATWVNSET